MATSTTIYQTSMTDPGSWLRSRNWDLTWITLSVALVATPYLAYLTMLGMQPVLQPVANLFGTTLDNLARNLVNAVVSLLIGGPHMYATFTRTALDRRFSNQHNRLLWSSLLIPVVVVALALLNLQLLLTVFFFWASVHVLHQIVYIIELYNNKRKSSLSLFSRLSDYAVVLTSLYPIAAWRIANRSFDIGVNNLSEVIASFVPLGQWMVWLAGGAFGIALIIWLGKTAAEMAAGTMNAPKTLFIAMTVIASFFVPSLGNLDTAFQGMNVWHSLQYLALTWMLNTLRQSRGDLESSPFVKRLSTDGSAQRYYLFTVLLTLGNILLGVVVFLVLSAILHRPFDYTFDRAYYIAVLSILWIHYYHDHFLFVEPKVIAA